MRELYRLIHSPTALLAFEAAARNLSFSRAADELNVTQPAVSAAVRKVEAALGTQLFLRQHRAIQLTSDGERLFNDVSFGLMHILRSAESISAQNTARHVTISCSTAFAYYWLVPRLSEFRSSFPDIDIRMETTDRDTELRRESLTLGIRRGAGNWPNCHSELLARERIIPVCSPAFLQKVQAPRTVEDLANLRLIHLDEPFRRRPKWSDWFAYNGLQFEDSGAGLRLNDYALVLQAAMAGEGIAFGWSHLVSDLLSKDLLVQAMDAEYRSGEDIYVVWSRVAPLDGKAVRMRDWLLGQGTEDQTGSLSSMA